MIRTPGSRPVRRMIAGAIAGIALVIVSATPAHAASASAGRQNFARECDAQVHVSDSTTSGMVEVFGGFACATGGGLTAEPTPATITLMIIRNGVEIKRSHYDIPKCNGPITCSTDSHATTYPDYSSTDNFQGRMVITSFFGSADITTGAIRT